MKWLLAWMAALVLALAVVGIATQPARANDQWPIVGTWVGNGYTFVVRDPVGSRFLAIWNNGNGHKLVRFWIKAHDAHHYYEVKHHHYTYRVFDDGSLKAHYKDWNEHWGYWDYHRAS